MDEFVAGQDRKCRVLGGTVLVGIIFCLVGLGGRLIHINTALADRLSAMVETQQTGRSTIPGRRGFILDVAGRTLASSANRPSVFADPSLIGDLAETARLLAPVLGRSAGEIEQVLRENKERRFCWLARLLDPADAAAVERLGVRGVGVRDEPYRQYPMRSLAGPTLGIVGRDGHGREGIEREFDDWLSGEDGRLEAIYDGMRRRRPIWVRGEGSEPPRDGGHVVLTIDSVIQDLAETHLREAVATAEAEAGWSVVMSPISGDVFALAQVPTFDPNRYGEATRERRRNRAICDAYEPGSIFKPYAAVGALAMGVVRPDEIIDCHNGLYYFGRRAMHDTTPLGEVPFKYVIARSSNIGMGIVATRMGNAALGSIVRGFGFGSRTGIAFPGESAGLLRPMEKWTEYSTTSIPIGQELAATPLQLATAFCAVVNGGTLNRPRLVKALLDADGEAVDVFAGPEVVRRVYPESVGGMMRDLLIAVVNEGGGFRARSDRWQVMGKTGTAEVAYSEGGGYEPDAYIGSFVGAAPAEDPQVVVLVGIYKPNAKRAYYGGKVAAPAAKLIIEGALETMQVPPSKPEAVAVGWMVDSMD